MPAWLDNIEALAVEGQKKILADMLKRGIPLVYRDKQGRMVKERPDGRIEVLEEPTSDGSA